MRVKVAADDAQHLLGRLCADLRLLRDQAGGPSLRGLSVRLGLSKSQVSVILNGRIRKLPDWPVVKGVVDGCRQYAQEHGRLGRLSLATGVEEYWRPRYALVEYALQDASRRKHAPVADNGSRPIPRELPGAVRHFVGRDSQLATLTRQLDDSAAGGTVVISAIAGTAGVGKTALAVHWAHQVAARFPDGQLYVNLHGFDAGGQAAEPPDVIHRFLGALGVPVDKIPSDLDSQAALYRSELAGKQVLILLDNARDSAQVRALLPGTPGCLAIVTSRNPLTSLVVSEDAHAVRLDLLAPGEARRLLACRIGADRVEAEPEAVEEIVTRCAALPLALAIVAAHAAAYPRLALRGLAEQLRDGRRLDLLNAGDPATDVRAVFSWSYQTLKPDAARLFRLLGLHPSPDTSACAAASLSARPPAEARAQLAELARAGLLTEHTPGRYGFHDLLRAYAVDLAHRVDPAGQREAAVRRVLDHYLHTAYAAAALLNPNRDQIALAPPDSGVSPEPLADKRQALDWIIAEQWTLLAAIDQSAIAGEDGHTWRLAWTLASFLEQGRRWSEQTAIQRAAVTAARRLDDPRAEALALRLLARADIEMGRFEEAAAHLTGALGLDVRTGDQAAQGHDHHHLAYLRDAQGDYTGALDHTHEALNLYRAAGHRPGQARALNAVGWYQTHLGAGREALAYCEQGLALLQELGDRYGQAAVWDSIGFAHHRLGEHADAIACFEQALALFRDLGERVMEGRTLVHLGDSHEATGDPDTAREAWRLALAILTELDHPERHALSARVATT
ncbi:tetratricopeptide repeat protein [Streptosporangiaceae bacterium NEAU-GS5]|nr:tetratricopeptide repeat protein [Streptosporangiaceae bacterium NEAU-GS5]